MHNTLNAVDPFFLPVITHSPLDYFRRQRNHIPTTYLILYLTKHFELGVSGDPDGRSQHLHMAFYFISVYT